MRGEAVKRLEKSSSMVFDLYLPEFWEKEIHPYLGSRLGAWRYRFPRALESSRSKAFIRYYDRSAFATPGVLEAVLEDRMRTLNAALITNTVQPLENVVCEGLAAMLPAGEGGFRDGQTPLLRILSFLEPPQLVQARLVQPLPGKRLSFGQLTYRTFTEQVPVNPKLTKHCQKVGAAPVPLLNRKSWIPAASGWFGKTYYFHPDSKATTWSGGIIERVSVLPLLQPERGTFGNSGHIVERAAGKFIVENHVVIEKLVNEPQKPWRILHF